MLKILLAGEGGQGVQTVAAVLTKAAQTSKLKTSYIPSFGVEQRGGVSLAYVQIAEENIAYPRFEKADIVVIFCDRAIEVVEKFITDDTLFIYDNSAIHTKALDDIKGKIKKSLPIAAQKLAQEKYSTKVLNMIILGALSSQIDDLDDSTIIDTIFDLLATKIAKKPELKELNLNAFDEGVNSVKDIDINNIEITGKAQEEIVKEFSDDKKTWTRFPEYCKGCALCIVRCPVKALRFSKEVGFLGNPIPEVDINTCIACGICEKTCPDGAVKIEKKQ
ncbi:MAG: 2-oxoacid:acceptor oxidoreductase family protein [Candidatus Berkelbacteria bacterium]